MRLSSLAFALALPLTVPQSPLLAQQPASPPLGYFRFPAVHGNTVVFTAEGDLWKVPLAGGTATRLTTASGEETNAAISPDGTRIAFSASYEGPTEVYVMPVDGGRPTRLTYLGSTATVTGWTPDGNVLYATREYSGLPNTQLAWVNPTDNTHGLVPLAQAADGSYDASGTLFFTRFPFQGSYTKRYHGGTAQSIWRFAKGGTEAQDLTADYTGTSRDPMVWQGRIYFESDRDGVMNLWSMDPDGHGLKQLTHQPYLDVKSPSLSDGRIVYQSGADLRVYDIASGRDALIPIHLVSDFDQTREKWDANPMALLSSAHLSPTGDRVVLTARGQVFIAPVGDAGGRLARVTHDNGRVRYRLARFMPDGKSLLGLSDKSGENEFWRVPIDGAADTQLTTGATILRWDGMPSPDGRYLAHTDKDQRLWLLNVETHAEKLLGTNRDGDFGDVQWAPDSKWVAYTAPASNQLNQVWVYSVASGQSTPVTSDRYDSQSPAWSPDGKWLYFLSQRNFQTAVGSPWGSRQPEPYFPDQTEVYALALVKGERSPFAADNELTNPVGGLAMSDSGSSPGDSARAGRGARGARGAGEGGGAARAPVQVNIDLDGIAERLIQVPIRAGEYSDLSTDGKRLYFMSRGSGGGRGGAQLMTYPIDNQPGRPQPFLSGVRQYELSMDGRKVLVRRGNDFFVFSAGAKAPNDSGKYKVDLSSWLIHVDPRAEWEQEFVDAWRLERDYFYDQHMNGVDWQAIRARYEPLVARVTDRAELSDLVAQAVAELSALHTFVRGGDVREPDDTIHPASLGAVVTRDETAGGYRVQHIYEYDPDSPSDLSPLARYGVNVHEGDVITAVNHVAALSAPDFGALMRNESGRQVLLSVKPSGNGTERDVVVEPITQRQESDLRYSEWEYTRRLAVDSMGKGAIGYVHLRAMGGADMNQWERDFYPVYNRQGLIIDARHNRGGNIDSWVLEKLIRKAWFYFQNRVGDPTWNMQFAYRGHIVLLTDAFTASDGEAFAEGFRQLGLGRIIGVRTWGGEIWLSQQNVMVDRGIASAAEMGTYLPNSTWMIEGHGVDPDTVVDNLPHATFNGRDAQLEAAVKELQAEIKADPRPVPPHPPYPDKSLKRTGGGGPELR
ncbi:MAG TPA: S41 family peptidase [Gemmatimonadaceae bacterium]|nr:S41 family peptidase [Gemmatimonadaceae bacterium]